VKHIRDSSQIDGLVDPFLRTLLASRLADLTQGEPYDPDLHGFVVVMQPGDSLAEVEAAIETPLLKDPVTGTEYGDPAFQPICEYVGRHPRWYELVIVPGDGDFGVTLMVPRNPDIEPRLLALCADYAVTEPPGV